MQSNILQLMHQYRIYKQQHVPFLLTFPLTISKVRQLSEEKAKVAAELIKEQEHLHAMETAIVSQQEQLKEAECQREKLHGELTDLHSKYKVNFRANDHYVTFHFRN